MDRSFRSGWADKFNNGSSFPVPLLKGRTAHLLVPMDTPPWYYRWVYCMPATHQIRKTLMPGPILHSTAEQRSGWLQKAGAMAAVYAPVCDSFEHLHTTRNTLHHLKG